MTTRLRGLAAFRITHGLHAEFLSTPLGPLTLTPVQVFSTSGYSLDRFASPPSSLTACHSLATSPPRTSFHGVPVTPDSNIVRVCCLFELAVISQRVDDDRSASRSAPVLVPHGLLAMLDESTDLT